MSTERSSTWSLTINNPTSADEEEIARARQRGWKVDGQLEKGENGTTHYQLILKTPQVRFSAVKKAFSRAHIEVARNVQALENYVHKEDTRAGTLASSSEKYPSLTKFWHLVYQKMADKKWLNFPEWDWWYELNIPFVCRNPTKRMPGEEIAMYLLDIVIGELIMDGYHIEHFYSPPNISIFKKFHFSVLRRAYDEIMAQTGRQTDMRSIDEESNVDMEHNNAILSPPEDDSSPSPEDDA